MLAMHALMGLAVLLPTASHDNNVEWNGVSHVDWLERLPICPVGGEAFQISFQTYQFDITSARVSVPILNAAFTLHNVVFASRT